MFKSFVFLTGLLVVLGGCATTQSGQSATDLQLRVSDLENQIAAKDAEIKDLKYTMKDMAYDLDRTKTRQPKTSKTDVYVKNDDILRVNVSPENVQRALKAAGYYKGNVDGKLGSGSKAAIKKFQKDHDLQVDGIIGNQTWKELQSAGGQ